MNDDDNEAALHYYSIVKFELFGASFENGGNQPPARRAGLDKGQTRFFGGIHASNVSKEPNASLTIHHKPVCDAAPNTAAKGHIKILKSPFKLNSIYIRSK